MPNLMMMTLTVSKELLARDTHTHTHTDTVSVLFVKVFFANKNERNYLLLAQYSSR